MGDIPKKGIEPPPPPKIVQNCAKFQSTIFWYNFYDLAKMQNKKIVVFFSHVFSSDSGEALYKQF